MQHYGPHNSHAFERMLVVLLPNQLISPFAENAFSPKVFLPPSLHTEFYCVFTKTCASLKGREEHVWYASSVPLCSMSQEGTKIVRVFWSLSEHQLTSLRTSVDIIPYVEISDTMEKKDSRKKYMKKEGLFLVMHADAVKSAPFGAAGKVAPRRLFGGESMRDYHIFLNEPHETFCCLLPFFHL